MLMCIFVSVLHIMCMLSWLHGMKKLHNRMCARRERARPAVQITMHAAIVPMSGTTDMCRAGTWSASSSVGMKAASAAAALRARGSFSRSAVQPSAMALTCAAVESH